MALHVDIIGDRSDRDPGFVGQCLVERHDADLRLHDRDALPGADLVAGSGLLLLLGSERSAHDPSQREVVEAESRIVTDHLAAGAPVLGICYGAQLLAIALGGKAHEAARAEIGWYAVQSRDEQLCPPVEWSQFHVDAFTPPSTSTVLGASPAGCQAFRDESAGGRALGWQFHPEVTADCYATWVKAMPDVCRQHGIDPDALLAEAPTREPGLRAAAFALTDAALAWLRP